MNILIIGTDLNGDTDLKTQGQFLRDLLNRHSMNASIASRYRNLVLRLLDTVYQILCLCKNDIVIVQVYGSMGIYLEVLSVWLARIKGCRVISTLHGGNIPVVYHGSVLKQTLFDNIFNWSHAITAPSRFIPHQIPSIENRYVLIRNHIELNQYHNLTKPQDCIRIFWMRSYHPTYDPIKAVQVLECIRSRNLEAKLVMAGKDFGQKNEILNYVSSSKYATDITIHDVIGNETKNEIASHSNVYLCTNRIDNAPVSFLEMMAMGLPIVTSNVGGIPLYVDHNHTALISSDNSVENMADLVIDLYQHKTKQQTLIMNGLSFIEEFSEETVSQKWLTLFSTLQPLTT